MECILKDGEVGFVAYAQMLGRSGESEIVCDCVVHQDTRRVGDVSVVGDCFVDDLEGTVCGLLSVVRCRRQTKDDQSVCRWVWLWQDCLLPGLLLALHLRELLHLLLLCHLCISGCSALGGFGGVGGGIWALLGSCWYSPKGWWASSGDEMQG